MGGLQKGPADENCPPARCLRGLKAAACSMETIMHAACRLKGERMEKIIVTYSAPDGEDVHGEKSAEYCVGCGFFNGGDQESNPGEAKGYGTCCPDVNTGLPPRECAVYASRVFHEMLRDLYALRGLLVSTRHMLVFAEDGAVEQKYIVPIISFYCRTSLETCEKWLDMLEGKDSRSKKE